MKYLKNKFVRILLLGLVTAGLTSNPVTAPYVAPALTFVKASFDIWADTPETPAADAPLQSRG